MTLKNKLAYIIWNRI